MTLTLKEAQEQLQTIQYKKGWRFEVDASTWDYRSGSEVHYWHLRITAETVNSYHPDIDSMTVSHTFPFSPMLAQTSEMLFQTVLRHVIMIETHEALEFFRVPNGWKGYQPFKDPHPNGVTSDPVLYSL